jgi:hypothetical protein
MQCLRLETRHDGHHHWSHPPSPSSDAFVSSERLVPVLPSQLQEDAEQVRIAEIVMLYLGGQIVLAGKIGYRVGLAFGSEERRDFILHHRRVNI